MPWSVLTLSILIWILPTRNHQKKELRTQRCFWVGEGQMVYGGDLGDALPTGRKSIYFLTNSITAKVVFSILDILSLIVQSELSVSNGPASQDEFIDVENRPSILPLTCHVKTIFFGNWAFNAFSTGIWDSPKRACVVRNWAKSAKG